ncbi:MAG: hypothetical protein WAU45_03075 [Blastocatellia bacterium]
MIIRQYSLVVFLFVATLAVVSCNRTSQATKAKPGTPENANSAAPQAGTAQTGASPKMGEATPAAPKLAGAYVMSEVHEKGVVNIISELKSVIYFGADGTYSRSSSKKGTVYHTDSGEYRIEGEDNLVLTIRMSKTGMDSKFHGTPIKKTHKFKLSSNGEELRMISDDGKVALFRRSDTLAK